MLHVHLPALREREGDVQYLLDHFLQKYAKALGKTVVGFSSDAVICLLGYHYPGNVRELSNIVEYAVNMSKKKKVGKEDLPPYLFEKTQVQGAASTENRQMSVQESEPMNEQSGAPDYRRQQQSWGDIERQLIVDTLKKNRGNRTKTAESLEWGRMKLWRKMQKYGL